MLLAADVGKFIKVQVTFTDKNDYTETLSSAATAAVEAAAPAPGPITGFTVVDASDQSVEGALADGGTLALDDPDGGSFGIRADLESGATIGSMRLQLTGAKTHDQTENIAPYSLYGDSGGNLSGESLPVGEYTLTATAYSEARLGGNVLGTLKVSFSVTGPATQQTNTPATGAPTISGTAQMGDTLTVDISGIDDDDGIGNATFSYQWIAGTTDISGATGSSYAPLMADLGKTIKVRVSFMDGASNVETLTSEATAAVTPKPNTPATGQPAISGTAHVGETLTVDISRNRRRRRLDQRFVQLPVALQHYHDRHRHRGCNERQLHPGSRRRGQSHQGAGVLHRRTELPGDVDQRGHRYRSHAADGRVPGRAGQTLGNGRFHLPHLLQRAHLHQLQDPAGRLPGSYQRLGYQGQAGEWSERPVGR